MLDRSASGRILSHGCAMVARISSEIWSARNGRSTHCAGRRSSKKVVKRRKMAQARLLGRVLFLTLTSRCAVCWRSLATAQVVGHASERVDQNENSSGRTGMSQRPRFCPLIMPRSGFGACLDPETESTGCTVNRHLPLRSVSCHKRSTWLFK